MAERLSRLNRLGDCSRKMSIYDHGDGEGVVDFLGRADAKAASPETIRELDMIHIALRKPPVREALAEALGIAETTWMLVGETRGRIFPDDPEGKPGDFDIIVGPLAGDRPAFTTLGMIEVKRSPVWANGKPKSRPTGLGTTQARGGALLGFDRVLLAHFVLGPDESIRTLPGKVAIPEHDKVAERIVKTIRREDRIGPGRTYGTLVAEWARGRGTSIERTGAIAFLLGDTTPRLVPNRERREILEAHLRVWLPSDRCPPVLARCDRCAQLLCTCSPAAR